MPGLLDPLKLNGYYFKNRLVMPPMQGNHATMEGGVTERLIEFYEHRAEGLGLIIVEHSYVSLSGQRSKRQLGIYDDHLVPGLKELVKRIQPFNTRLVIQINHAGAKAAEDLGIDHVAPSATEEARELSVDEVEAIKFAFSRAADRAVNAGFDGVEVHGAHGFLLNQFYSPLTNRRNDGYGGNLRNRMRFPLEVVREVRKRLGSRLLLYRLGSVDLQMMGTQLEDSLQFAKALEQAGVNILHVSGGMCGGSPDSLAGQEGFFFPQAEEIRRVVDIPVIGVGGVKNPWFADQAVRDDKVDFVAVGRALRADPLWAIKALKSLKVRST
jgi:2,4-dienoyl-CoA reductase-like NADH-dependent reductase (Old Yellow Enzyme family)